MGKTQYGGHKGNMLSCHCECHLALSSVLLVGQEKPQALEMSSADEKTQMESSAEGSRRKSAS